MASSQLSAVRQPEAGRLPNLLNVLVFGSDAEWSDGRLVAAYYGQRPDNKILLDKLR